MSDTFSVIMWSMILVAALVLLAVVVNLVRKHFLASPEQAAGPAFTVGDLRKLRDEGQISDDEFEKAKAKILAATQAAIARSDARRQEGAVKGTGNAELDTILEIERRRKRATPSAPPPPPDSPEPPPPEV